MDLNIGEELQNFKDFTKDFSPSVWFLQKKKKKRKKKEII